MAKEKYMAPEVELVETRVERGFQQSGTEDPTALTKYNLTNGQESKFN